MNPSNFIFLLAVVSGTIMISYWSATRGSSTAQFYSAERRLTGMQNGMALAGDFISAASFLGVTGAVAVGGYDGLLFCTGFLMSYLLLLLFAEPVHHLGKFTLGDVLCSRFPFKSVRIAVAVNTVSISILYMVPQLIGGGMLLRLLLGISYPLATLITGVLMTLYVIVGGMVSTSWVQIIKTALLMGCVFLLTLIVLSRFDWNVGTLVAAVVRSNPFGSQFFGSGKLFPNALDQFSIRLSLILGTAGLPHILIRFFTVKDTDTVRRTLLTATFIVGGFYVMVVVLGLGTVGLVGWHALVSIDPTGNLAVPFLAHALGGDFFMAFVSAVAFATILAVVTGLLLAATSALAHDVYNQVLRDGEAPERKQLLIARFAAGIIGLISILVSLGIGHINVAFPVSTVFVVAAATNVPLLIFTLWWRSFTHWGAIATITAGLTASIILVIVDPFIARSGNTWLAHTPLFHVNELGIVAIPLGFLAALVGTLMTPRDHRKTSRSDFLRLQVQMETGMASHIALPKDELS